MDSPRIRFSEVTKWAGLRTWGGWKKVEKQIGKNLPLGRTGETKEIADLVHTIISNEIKYLNGQTIFLDGGISNTIF